MINFLKHFFLGVALGLALLFFFIGYDANAMIISNTGLDVRDSDIIGTTIDASNPYETIVKIQYIDEWKDTIGIDEIGENYERVDNTYKVYTGKVYHRDVDLWFKVRYATTTIQEFEKATQEKEISGLLKYIISPVIAQDSFYTDTGDGSVYVGNANWATARALTTGSTQDTIIGRIGYPGSSYQIIRGFLPFDTSSLDDDLVAASGTLFLYSYDGYDNCNDANGFMALTGSTDPDPETLEATDFDNFTDTVMSSEEDITGLNYTGWNTWSLATSGLSEVDTGGWTQYVMREGHDINDSACSSGYSGHTHYSVAESGKEPYLLLDMEAASSTSTEATSTTISIPCDLVPNNELSMAVWCVEEWGTSTSAPEKTYYGYAHIPFLIWFILAIPTLWLASRLLLEFIIRLRRY